MSAILRQEIESIVPVTDQEFELIFSYFTPRNFRRHQFMVQDGNAVTSNYFLVNGLTKSFYVDETGKEHILQFAIDNDWVTDMAAFHAKTVSTLNIYCLENCETLAITYDNIEKLCSQLDKMQYYFRKQMTEENRRLQQRVQCLVTNNAANRYHDLITNYPELIQRVPKKMIASYLGVSRETLSRLITQ